MSALPHMTDCGLPGITAIPYGIHMCHFYETRADLAAALVPYFVAGLNRNERCIWITAEPLDAHAARAELAQAGLSVAALERKGALLVRDHADWYGRGGGLDGARTKAMWLDEEARALEAGYNGLRITGNTSFLSAQDWPAFMDYEEAIDREFASRRIVTLCSYVDNRRAAADLLDVARRHHCTLDRPDQSWQILSARNSAPK